MAPALRFLLVAAAVPLLPAAALAETFSSVEVVSAGATQYSPPRLRA